MTDATVVRLRVQDHIALVTIDHPPVNALGVAVRRGLLQAITQADADAGVNAVLLVGAGKAFIAGADIREFGLPPQAPSLPEVCAAIEACSKPVVAAIHGLALGGGLEVAMAAHYRVATASAKLGLPEVQLGLLPGAGGTQRAPRLVGAQAALDLMLSGRHMGAQEALRLGLIDRVLADGMADAATATAGTSKGTNANAISDVQAEGMAFTRHVLAEKLGVRRTCDQTDALADRTAQQAAIDAARAEAAQKRGLFSPLKIVDCVQAALDQPFEQGLRTERALFEQCLASPQRAGLVHAFFAEREVPKVPEASAGQPRPIQHVGVIGGGTMGAGIAVSLLDAGLHVTLIERDDAALAQGRARVAKVYEGQIAKGRLTPEGMAGTLARWQGATDYAALASADLVIEAVFEDMAVKHTVFAQLSQVCQPGTVLATNTSYLDINVIAAGTPRPQDVIGLHFFSPANIMRLLEVVVPARASVDAVATGFALARLLKKTAVRAGVCDGFIGNRILAAYRTAADHMLEDGASPYAIDQMARGFGFPMGPYEVSDLAGGDIGWAARQRRQAARDPAAPAPRYVRIADALCERGWFGQKTGRGWYRYEAGSRAGVPDPDVLAIVADERSKAGFTPRAFSVDELQRRYLAAMVNEGAKVVAEGIALRPLDVDVVLMQGYGFPRWRGGPMKWADMVGLDKILADIRTFAQADPLFWQPADVLVQLVEQGRSFDSLNKAGAA
jgi:3-hydroxyacyl-CoA dehydrogenase